MLMRPSLGVTVLLLALATAGRCGELNTGSSNVQLAGRLIEKTYKDADGHTERVLVLRLSHPISVAADEFGGPVDGVTETQLVVPPGWNLRSRIGKEISVIGKLFYPTTAHHHTKVLVEVTRGRQRTTGVSFPVK